MLSVLIVGQTQHQESLKALFAANINIQMISTSEIKISVLIDCADADKAVSIIHKRFFDDPDPLL